ncbi:hypothetical protein CEXT_168321 [Caerostris extrusa]|uniref:Uncharacterized protein n=1 Tax=Caerostris extrusa TaxID=172846 RepID=A0AAV4S793_CAEEX|nr:hypothetical protein CEXT_168321 [Caerostris extrusa]
MGTKTVGKCGEQGRGRTPVHRGPSLSLGAWRRVPPKNAKTSDTKMAAQLNIHGFYKTFDVAVPMSCKLRPRCAKYFLFVLKDSCSPSTGRNRIVSVR